MTYAWPKSINRMVLVNGEDHYLCLICHLPHLPAAFYRSAEGCCDSRCKKCRLAIAKTTYAKYAESRARARRGYRDRQSLAKALRKAERYAARLPMVTVKEARLRAARMAAGLSLDKVSPTVLESIS